MAFLEQVSGDRNHWVGRHGPLLVVLWIGMIDPAVCRALTRIARTVSAEYGDRQISVVSITTTAASAPDAEARKALAMLVRDSDSSIARIALVREAQGFVASAMASIVIGVHMLARSTLPHRVFGDIAEAMEWATAPLREFRQGNVTAKKLADEVRQKSRALVQPQVSA